MNISYEDFFKLSYSLIDLNDEEYLKDEERLRYIISKIKVKNPKKYLKEENSFKLTKEIFEECKEDLIFLKYILNKLNVNNKAKNIIETYLECIGNIEFYLRDFELPFEKIQEIHLKYLDSFKDKTNFNIINPLQNSVVTSRFGTRNSTEIVSANHKGIDLGATTGTSIISAMDGTVIEASSKGDYGIHLKIQNNDVVVVYAHCSELLVKEGDKVNQGMEIAKVGSTGKATGPHLHFEIRRENRAVNPEYLLQF